jgi:hypothetical protein
LLRDRHELSLQNQWINENDEVYLIYSRENMQDMLGCSYNTARKAIDQLKEYGLMEEERMGLNRPNRIYLTAVSIDNQGVSKSESPEFQNLNVKNFKNRESRVSESKSLEFQNMKPNDTEYNNTEISDTKFNHINQSNFEIDGWDEIEKRDTYESIIKENIDYEILVMGKRFDKENIDNILGIMVDVCSLPDNTKLKVNSISLPISIIRDRFLKINPLHIEYIMESLQDNPSNVRNIRAYIITTIFNAPNTISQFYRSKVNHDYHTGVL